jgi:hypothetical protein
MPALISLSALAGVILLHAAISLYLGRTPPRRD